MTLYHWSSTAAANATADGTINWAEGQAPSTVNDSGRAMMAATAKFRNDIAGVTTAGSSTAFTLTSNQNFDSLVHLDGNIVSIIPHTTSGAAPTLSVDGLTAHALNQSSGVAIPTGALIQGSPYLFLYVNATTEFLLFTAPAVTVGTPQANSVTSTALAAGAVTYAKVQNAAAARLLGNPSSTSSAAPSEISLGAGLIFAGSTVKTGGAPTVQTFTSGTSSTYTQTSSLISWIFVCAVAGGGGGGGTTNGSTGGTTTFNSINAIGGSGGTSAAGGRAGGAGGTGGTGTANYRRAGTTGGNGNAQGGSSTDGGTGGNGGGTRLGDGGGMNAGAAAPNTGGGGGGLQGPNPANNGGGGGGGGEYFELVISSPSSTYIYTVGAAGARGTSAGSAAAGAVIVYEFYN